MTRVAEVLLRAASLVAPRTRRAEWLEEWQSELWYIAPRDATTFCLGAFRDALWVRRHTQRGRAIDVESPLRCLAWLGALAVVSCSIVLLLPAPTATGAPHLTVHELPAGCFAMLLLSVLLLPATWLVMGPAPLLRGAASWRQKAAARIFLALKILLVQPAMLCGFLITLRILKVIPIAPQLAVASAWFLGFRWVLTDQRRRCPVCLRLLTNAVRIGNPSHTFLEWYGAESVCSRGHGLLQISEESAPYSGAPRWLRLDASWSGLFWGAGWRRHS